MFVHGITYHYSKLLWFREVGIFTLVLDQCVQLLLFRQVFYKSLEERTRQRTVTKNVCYIHPIRSSTLTCNLIVADLVPVSSHLVELLI